jgi:hypothetical protein
MKIITLLRKPLDGNVAENTLKHGCGGVNIDATRVGTENRVNPSASENRIYGQFKGAEREGRDCVGRWPANFVLTHSDGCVLKEDWDCVEGCPVQELDAQSGIQKSGVAGSKSRAWGVSGEPSLSSSDNGVGWKAYGSEGYGDIGGASRYFMQFQKDEE